MGIDAAYALPALGLTDVRLIVRVDVVSREPMADDAADPLAGGVGVADADASVGVGDRGGGGGAEGRRGGVVEVLDGLVGRLTGGDRVGGGFGC